MRHKISLFLFSLALTLSLGSLERVLACSCVRTTSCQAYNNADVVFVGKVIGSKEQKTVADYSETSQNSNTSTPTKPKTITYDVGEIYFEVQESFMGIEKNSRVTINSGTGDCGFLFKRGEIYVVFASKEDSTTSSGISSLTYGGSAEKPKPDANRLWTNICSGTQVIGNARETLSYLINLSSSETEGTIFGEIREFLSYRKDEKTNPFGNITVRFHLVGGEEKFYETVTDASGKYEIKVPANRYEIDPVLPEYAQIRDAENEDMELEVKPNACAKADFTIVNKGQINGKLISSDGKPIVGVDVEVIDFETKEWVTDAISETNGAFSIKKVPAGQYILAVNKNISPHAESPFPTTFYPKTSNMAQAQIIKIGLGQSINEIVIQMLPKLKEKEVHGIVYWTNGKPAVGVSIELEDLDNKYSFYREERNAQTDNNGKFIVKGFIGRKYQIKAEYSKEVVSKDSRLVRKIGNNRFAPATFYRAEKTMSPFVIEENLTIPKIILKLEITMGSIQL